MDRDELIGCIWKSKLLLSDCFLTERVEEKEMFLSLVNRYVDRIGDSKLSLIFEKVCQSTGKEEDIYAQILIDIFTEMETELHIVPEKKDV